MTTIAVESRPARAGLTPATAVRDPLESIDWVQSIPFIAFHLLVIPAIWYTGVSWSLVGIAVATYVLRMFGVTAGYHRYFSHRAFKTGRVMQFIFALIGTLAAQKGVLWWAANHRHHHRYSDQVEDIHSPARRGFWWSHVGWILSRKYTKTDTAAIRDFAKFPELVWLDKYWYIPLLAIWATLWPILGFAGFVWGGLVSTVMLWHGTFTINSLSHVFGSRRYETTDTSRNNWLLAIVTGGEGWHNNHHYYPASANQGFFWYEYDFSWRVLWCLSKVGLVWDMKSPPRAVLEGNRAGAANVAASSAVTSAALDAQEAEALTASSAA